MAYAVTLPPKRIGGGIGAGGSLWLYQSADVHTDVDAADYFSNGWSLGLRVGDVVLVVETDNTYALSLHVVTVSTVGGASTVAARVTS